MGINGVDLARTEIAQIGVELIHGHRVVYAADCIGQLQILFGMRVVEGQAAPDRRDDRPDALENRAQQQPRARGQGSPEKGAA